MTPEQYKIASATMYLTVTKNLIVVTLDALKWFGNDQCKEHIEDLTTLHNNLLDIEAINDVNDTIAFIQEIGPIIQKLIIPANLINEQTD